MELLKTSLIETLMWFGRELKLLLHRTIQDQNFTTTDMSSPLIQKCPSPVFTLAGERSSVILSLLVSNRL